MNLLIDTHGMIYECPAVWCSEAARRKGWRSRTALDS